MPSRIALIWALATGATILAAGAAATFWVHPGFLWPDSSPAAIADRAPEPAPFGPSTASASAPSAQAAPVVAAAEPPAPAAAPSAEAPPPGAKPAFDVVSVEPTGETVVAGRATPNTKVELRDAGQTVGEATANATGQFVVIPPPLAPGGHSLSLATGAGKSAAETSNPIAVSVPAAEGKTAVVAPAPAKSAAPASSPAMATPLAIPAPAAASRIAIQSVEANSDGGLAVKGGSDPNGTVRLYLNGAYVADARTKSDGRWSLKVQHGVTPGAYVVRADEINPADAKVIARAEAPFAYPAAPTSAAAAAPSVAISPLSAPAPVAASVASASGAPASELSPADVVVDSVQTDRVVRGDTLWGISRTFYGDGTRFRLIFGANTNQIRNPNLIYPGENLIVPKPEPKP